MIKTAVALFILCFLIFNANFSFLAPNELGDTVTPKLASFTLLSGKGLYFDEYAPFLKELYDPVYFLHQTRGHFVSTFSLLPGLLTLPFYVPSYVYLRSNSLGTVENFYNHALVVEKLSASFITSVSVVIFFGLMYLISGKKWTSVSFALIFAFATQTFSINSQLLWHSVATNFLILISLYFLWKELSAQVVAGSKYITLGFLAAVIAFFGRNILLPYLVLYLLICYLKRRRYFLSLLVVFLLALVVACIHNYYFFDSIVGDYAQQLKRFPDYSLINNTLGVFLSPARGIVFYTPIFILSLFSLFSLKNLKNEAERTFLLFNYAYFVFLIVINIAWAGWWGGASWGNRLLTEGAVPAVILLYYFYKINQGLIKKFLIITLSLWSVVTQLVGVFYYPRGRWDIYPTEVAGDTDRLWDFEDNPISRQVVAGPELTGIYRMYYLLTSKNSQEYRSFESSCSLDIVDQENFLGYKVLKLKLHNQSNAEWVTNGNSQINIRSVFYDKASKILVESPIPSGILPPVIAKGRSAVVKLVVVPPGSGDYEVMVAPVQERVAWWDRFCNKRINFVSHKES